jgi:hypothetical protein
MTKVRYSLNWMGPISISWYKSRGLTTRTFVTGLGKTIETDEITEHYSAGRIDVSDGSAYGDEISVPVMKSADWHRFSDWLETFETDFTWTLEQLVEMYERANPKICWYQEPQHEQTN